MLKKSSDYVLVTRSEPGLSETINLIKELGGNPLASPVFSIKFLPFQFPLISLIQAIVFTSGQAVASVIQNKEFQSQAFIKDLPVFTVGDTTAYRAYQAGFSKVMSAGADAVRLVKLIADKQKSKQKLLWIPCGKGQGKFLSTMLQQQGFQTLIYEVYEIRPLASLSEEVLKVIQQERVNSILFCSAVAASCFMEILPKALQRHCHGIRALVISQKTANVFPNSMWGSIEIAEQPNLQSMLSFIKESID